MTWGDFFKGQIPLINITSSPIKFAYDEYASKNKIISWNNFYLWKYGSLTTF